MNFELTEEQSALLSAVQAIVQDHLEVPRDARHASHYVDVKLQRLLEDNGFLDANRDFGPLGAALVVEEAARAPVVTEVAASALVVPQLLGGERLAGPVALVAGDSLTAAHRHLGIARTAVVDLGEDVAILALGEGDVVTVDSVLAYPYGRFVRAPDLGSARRLAGLGPRLRQWWRVGLAAEFAGAAQSAIQCTVQHVKQRQVFGHPVGVFQAVQHRLVQCQYVATGVHWLALRAAWSGEAVHADLAACYAQQSVRRLLVDLHQFCGAMGVTYEFPLHFWTYRLRGLQAEAGGLAGAAGAYARMRWGACGTDGRR
jgi:alkylation response protein AidB-like acyl-CoA dehydrogenase